MDELSGKLEELRIAHDIGHIDELVYKLQESSYVSSATRSRVIEIFRYKAKSLSPGLFLPEELGQLEKYFVQSTTKYIPRHIVRRTIAFLNEVKQSRISSPKDQSTWTKDEWFCQLVDSDVIIGELGVLLDRLHVCRHNIIPSLCTIVLFGKMDEDDFFAEFNKECKSEPILESMTDTTMRSVFKYYGGFAIDGSLDCAHLMAGNDMRSVVNNCLVGTVGGFFKFGERMVSVTAAHVVPEANDYKVKDADVAFIHVQDFVQFLCNPLFVDPDRSIFEHFQFPQNFPFDPEFLRSLEPGTKIIKLGSRSGLTEGRLLCASDSVTFYEKKVKYEVKNCVSVAWQSDERFTAPGDSGSVYYAVRGSLRYPIAVHRASVVLKGRSVDRVENEHGEWEKLQIHTRISIATPLGLCLDEYAEEFNRRAVPLNDSDAEDSCILPEWIDRIYFEKNPFV